MNACRLPHQVVSAPLREAASPGQTAAAPGSANTLFLDGRKRSLSPRVRWRFSSVTADDGFIRDVGEISRAFKVSPATDRVLELVADYLADHTAGPCLRPSMTPSSLSKNRPGA